MTLLTTREKPSMKYLNLLILIIFFVFSTTASAEFYKYVDENGDVRYTDDINMVPEEQRSKIRSYVESQSEDVPAPAEQNEVTPENQAEPEDATESEQQVNFPDLSEDEPESFEDAKDRLDLMKAEIDKEYEALKLEKQQLAEEKKEAKTREQIMAYNKKVEDLNKRVETYVEKGKAYKTEVDAYNNRIIEDNKNKENNTQ